MSRIFITGSTSGLGYLNAEHLLDAGHDVVVHARSGDKLPAVQGLLDRGARAVIGDFANLDGARSVVKQANDLGRMDAVIHNAGVLDGPDVFAVNVLAPYVLTAGMHRASRLIYLTSGWHREGRTSLNPLRTADGQAAVTYRDSKLFVTTLAAAVARLWPEVLSNAVDPGWMPTKLGGEQATGDLDWGTRTQEWLAVADDPLAQVSGEYWHYQERAERHPSVTEATFQDHLLETLAEISGVTLSE